MARQKKFNFKTLLLLLIAIAMVAGVVACKQRNQLPVSDFSLEVDAPTGLLDKNGDVITNAETVTEVITVTNERVVFVTNEVYIPGKEIYITNIIKGDTIVKTNYVYVDKVYTNTVKVTNTVVDTNKYVSKYHNSFMYRIYAPFTGIGPEGEYKYTNVSYLDTPTLSALWKKMMNMESHRGRQFTIRNRQTGTYFFFDSNGNLKWSRRPLDVLKWFVQGIIIQYRGGNDTKGAYAIAGLYRNRWSSAELSEWNDDGVNMVQGYHFRKERAANEFEIIVMNPGHVINGKEYGYETYNTTCGYPAGTNPYFEQRPEYIMSKITHVFEGWKNYRPWELYDLTFQQTTTPLPNLWK